jgi:hypothetical protein
LPRAALSFADAVVYDAVAAAADLNCAALAALMSEVGSTTSTAATKSGETHQNSSIQSGRNLK